MPGIITNYDGELLIHASLPRENSTSLNHLPIGYLFHLGDTHSVIAPEAIDQLDVYTGSFDVTYGNALGGVVDITPRYPSGDNSGHTHVGLYNTSASYDFSLAQTVDITIAGRRSYIDLLTEQMNKTFNNIADTVIPDFWDLNLLASYTRDQHIFSFESISAGDKLSTTHNSDENILSFNKSQNFQSYGVRWRYLNDIYHSNTLLSQLETIEKYNSSDLFQSTDTSSTTTLYHLSQWLYNDHTFSAGLELQQQYVTYKSLLSTYQNESRYNVFTYEPFIQNVYHINNSLALRMGLRASSSTKESTVWNVMPRTAIIATPSESNIISFAVGRYNNRSGNDPIDETSYHYSALWTHFFDQYQKSCSLTVEPYYKAFDDLYLYQSNEEDNHQGHGFAYGCDITIKKRSENLYFHAAYGYQQSKRSKRYHNNNDLYTFGYEIPHSIQIGSSYKLNQDWTVSGLFKYSSGRLYTPTIGTHVDNNGDITPIKGIPNSKRLPERVLVNAKIKHSIYWDSGSMLDISFEIRNLINYKNVSHIKEDKQYNEIGYYYDLPILPVFDLTYYF